MPIQSPEQRRAHAEARRADWLQFATVITVEAEPFPRVLALLRHGRFKEHLAIIGRLGANDHSPTHPVLFLLLLRAIGKADRERVFRALEFVLAHFEQRSGTRFAELRSRLLDRRNGHAGVVAELEFAARFLVAGRDIDVLDPPGPDFRAALAGRSYLLEVKALRDSTVGEPHLLMGDGSNNSGSFCANLDPWAEKKLAATLEQARDQARRCHADCSIAVLANDAFFGNDALRDSWQSLSFRWADTGLVGAWLRTGESTPNFHCLPVHRPALEELTGVLRASWVFDRSMF